MPNHYCLRVTVKGDDETAYREKVLKVVSSLGSGLGCFESPAKSNPHYHFMIESEMKLAAVRKKIQELYEKGSYVPGSKRYSLQNREGNYNYICKGHLAYRIKKNMPHYDGKSPPVIIWNPKGFDDEDIEEYHEAFWEDQKNLYKIEKREKKEFIDLVEEWWNGPMKEGSHVNVSEYFGRKWCYATGDRMLANQLAFDIHEAFLDRFGSLRKLSIYAPHVARQYVAYLLHGIIGSKMLSKLIMSRDQFFG